MNVLKNIWLGSDELVIIKRHGTCHVLEKDEDYDIVFGGNYKQCLEYLEKRRAEYQESVTG